jgi:hypothetical protein
VDPMDDVGNIFETDALISSIITCRFVNVGRTFPLAFTEVIELPTLGRVFDV